MGSIQLGTSTCRKVVGASALPLDLTIRALILLLLCLFRHLLPFGCIPIGTHVGLDDMVRKAGEPYWTVNSSWLPMRIIVGRPVSQKTLGPWPWKRIIFLIIP